MWSFSRYQQTTWISGGKTPLGRGESKDSERLVTYKRQQQRQCGWRRVERAGRPGTESEPRRSRGRGPPEKRDLAKALSASSDSDRAGPLTRQDSLSSD